MRCAGGWDWSRGCKWTGSTLIFEVSLLEEFNGSERKEVLELWFEQMGIWQRKSKGCGKMKSSVSPVELPVRAGATALSSRKRAVGMDADLEALDIGVVAKP